jgi:hypothetical protein
LGNKKKEMKIIDIQTGAVIINGASAIGQHTSLAEALASVAPLSEKTEIDDMGTG